MKMLTRLILALCLAAVPVAPGIALAGDPGPAELLTEIKALKAKVAEMEGRMEKANQAAQQAQQAAAEARKTSGHSLKVSEEAAKTKAKQPQGILSEAGKWLKVYGAVELEASYANHKPKRGESSTESNFTLATAEIFFDATINKYTKGLLHLLYEEGDTDPINVDEAFILIGQTDDLPFYFLGGRMYPAIGLFETAMVSDPITQNVFETQATAAEIGWAQDWFNVGIGAYNSSIHEGSDAPDNPINTFYARLQLDVPDGVLGDEADINAGIAYTNNIAGGNLGDGVVGQELQSLVGGLSLMLNLRYKQVTLNAEYITAADDFQAGELAFSDKKARPYAFNLEVAYKPVEDWTFAARYEGSGDLGDFEPESQYGLTVAWDFLPDTTISLEYLHGEYENDDERDLVTCQLAVSF